MWKKVQIFFSIFSLENDVSPVDYIGSAFLCVPTADFV